MSCFKFPYSTTLHSGMNVNHTFIKCWFKKNLLKTSKTLGVKTNKNTYKNFKSSPPSFFSLSILEIRVVYLCTNIFSTKSKFTFRNLYHVTFDRVGKGIFLDCCLIRKFLFEIKKGEKKNRAAYQSYRSRVL